jgi:hypothetical protein
MRCQFNVIGGQRGSRDDFEELLLPSTGRAK